MAVGNRGRVQVSPEGTTWSWVEGVSFSPQLLSVAYGNSKFIATGGGSGYGGIIAPSFDGVFPWTNCLVNLGKYICNVIYVNGQFVAVGGMPGSGWEYSVGTILTSQDGISWTSHSSRSGSLLRAIAFGNNRFVAVGDSGTILQSGVIAPAKPTIGPLVLLSSGAAHIIVTGVAGQIHAIQTSIDLTHWLTLTNLALTNSLGEFVDNSATNSPQRFYRSVVP